MEQELTFAQRLEQCGFAQHMECSDDFHRLTHLAAAIFGEADNAQYWEDRQYLQNLAMKNLQQASRIPGAFHCPTWIDVATNRVRLWPHSVARDEGEA